MTGEFSLLPAPEPTTLRTVTLGTMLVCGGILAALPFRRYQTIPDASSAPAHLTGPTESLLQPSESAPQHVNSFRDACPIDLAESPASTYYGVGHAAVANGERFRRRAGMPLTYEDLEIPIALPAPIAERFNATSPIRAIDAEQDRALDKRMVEIVMPSADALAASQVAAIEKAASQFADQQPDQKRVSGALASAREGSIDPLPKSDSAGRQRHWIRQPE